MHETLSYTIRTIWQARCTTCGYHIERTENPPKEILCPRCHEKGKSNFLKFHKISYTGPSLSKRKGR